MYEQPIARAFLINKYYLLHSTLNRPSLSIEQIDFYKLPDRRHFGDLITEQHVHMTACFLAPVYG